MVLLEDADAAGVGREHAQERGRDKYGRSLHAVTLSGLLNVIDGPTSQEGRLLVMTTNHIEALDAALIRPGRIDKKVYLGHVTQHNAAKLFFRVFSHSLNLHETDEKPMKAADSIVQPASVKLDLNFFDSIGGLNFNNLTDSGAGSDDAEAGAEDLPGGTNAEKPEDFNNLEKLSQEFAALVPEHTFTPAEIQGYLLEKRSSPADAIQHITEWVEKTLADKDAAAAEAAVAAEQAKVKVETAGDAAEATAGSAQSDGEGSETEDSASGEDDEYCPEEDRPPFWRGEPANWN